MVRLVVDMEMKKSYFFKGFLFGILLYLLTFYLAYSMWAVYGFKYVFHLTLNYNVSSHVQAIIFDLLVLPIAFLFLSKIENDYIRRGLIIALVLFSLLAVVIFTSGITPHIVF